MEQITIKPTVKKLVFGSTISTIIGIVILIIGITLIPTFQDKIFETIEVPSIIFTIINLVLFFFLTITIVSYIAKITSYKSISYDINPSLIKKHKKLFAEEKITIPFEQVTNIQYTKTWILDKLFSTGNIYLHTAGSSSYDLELQAVKNPQKLYDKIQEYLEFEKSDSIDENGEFTSNTSSSLQKRIKPQPIFPTLAGIIGVPVFFIFTGIPFALGALVFSFLTSENFLYGILGVLIIISLVGFWIGGSIITYLSYKRRYYDFYKHKIEFYDGFFTKRKATLDTQRITNIDNNQGIFGRIFNFHTITIETAGSSGAEITISYIKDGDVIVEELKEVLKEHGRN